MNAARYSKWCLAMTVGALSCGALEEGSHVEECVPKPCPMRSIGASLVDGTISWDAGELGTGTDVDLTASRECRVVLPAAEFRNGSTVGWGHGVSVVCDLAVKGTRLTVFLPELLDLSVFSEVRRYPWTGKNSGLQISICANPSIGCPTSVVPPSDKTCAPLLDDVAVNIDVEEATGKTVGPPALVTSDFRRVVAITLDTGARRHPCSGGTMAVSLSLRLQADPSNYQYYPDEYCSCP